MYDDAESIVPFEEAGELRCSDLDVPLLFTSHVQQIIHHCQQDYSANDWNSLAYGRTDSPLTSQLKDLCQSILEEVKDYILEVVVPQIEARNSNLAHKKSPLPSLDSSGIESETSEKYNYSRLTEDDVRATLGFSLNHAFGAAMGRIQHSSIYSMKLLDLVAPEIANRVNNILQATCKERAVELQGTGESERDTEPEDDVLSKMVDVVSVIIWGCMSSAFVHDVNNIGDNTDNVSAPNKMDPFKELHPTNDYKSKVELWLASIKKPLCSSEEPSEHSSDIQPQSCSQEQSQCSFNQGLEGTWLPSEQETKPLDSQQKTFVIMVLTRLVFHIVETTKTTFDNVNVDWMIPYLWSLNLDPLETTDPETSKDLHILIYTDMCLLFGDPMLLRESMAQTGNIEAFVEAFSEKIMEHTKKSSGELGQSSKKQSQDSLSFAGKIRKFFKRSTKVCPMPQTSNQEPQSEVSSQEQEVAPSKKKKKGLPRRMVSTVGKYFRSIFS